MFEKLTLRLFLICICLVGQSAFAQDVSVASVRGDVLDPSGAAIVNATVTLTETQQQTVHTAATDSSGHYTFPDLPVGSYQLDVKAIGFKNYLQTGIVLEVGQNVEANVAMELGNLSETVEVQANAGMVETQESRVAQVINEKQINDLPLNGRQATQLVLLSGAAVQSPGPIGGDLTGSKTFYSSVTISVAGGQANATNYLLDGGYNVDTFTNLNFPFPFPDTLQEFSVETSSLPAQYGDHPGGVVNVVTKSGTNEFHGDLFDYLRNGIFNARGYFATAQDSLKRNQYGGTLGGRIIRDKLFFFGGFQGTPNRSNPPSTISYVPTEAEEGGDFSILGTSTCGKAIKGLVNPTTDAPYNPANPFLIPASAFDPAAVKLLKYLPPATNACGQVTYGIPANNNEYEWLGRGDWNINSKQAFFARYFLDDYTQPANFSPSNVLVTTSAGNAERAQTITLGHTYTLSATSINSIHFTFERRRDDRGPAAQGVSPATIGSQVFSQDPDFLETSVSGYFNTYCSTCNHAYFDTNTWAYADDVTLVRGRHQLMFGVDVIRTQLNADNNYLLDGSYAFSQGFSGNNLADFLLGYLSTYDQSRVQATANRQTNPQAYAQDAFRVNDKLSITAGIRWEPMLFPQDQFGRGSTFNMADFLNGTHSAVYPGAPAGMLYYGDPGVPKAFVHDNRWDFAPRLGLVFTPGSSGRDTIRIGGALLYDTTELFFDERVQSNPPFVDEIDETFSLNTQKLLPSNSGTLSNPWSNYPGGNPFPISKAFFPAASALYVLMPLNLKPTSIAEYNFSYQHQFAGNWLVGLNYIGNKTSHIYTGEETDPANYIPGSKAGTQARRTLTLLNPAEGTPIGSMPIADDGANADYNAMLVSLEHRLSKNYSLLTNYTWSHCISEADFGGEITGQEFQIPYDLRADRGNCVFDVRQIFNASFVGTTPGFSNTALRLFASHWQFAPIVSVHSGFPVNVTSGKDNSQTGIGEDRPNQVLSSVYESSWGPGVQYLNPAAFAQNPIGTFGDVGRFSVFGPGYFDIDASVSRIFALTERFHLEARAEGFNILNHTNFSNPNTNLNTSNTFGRITSANANRILQFALKLHF